MSDFSKTVITGTILCLFLGMGFQAMSETADRKVKVNLTAVRWKFQEPYLLLAAGSPVFRLFYTEQERRSYELACRDFQAEKLAKVFNVIVLSVQGEALAEVLLWVRMSMLKKLKQSTIMVCSKLWCRKSSQQKKPRKKFL